MFLKFSFLLFLSTFFTGQIMCQSAFPFFSESQKMPEKLLSERSVVFMNTEGLEWETKAVKIHKYFNELGIDAVAYYALSDIMSGHDATNSFYYDITKRSIENMIIIHEANNQFSLYIGKISEGGQFFTQNMPVYQLSAPKIEDLGNKLKSQINQAGLERNNFLIIDVPETFNRTNVIKSRRVADYNADLRIDKLAVPKFESSVMMTGNIEEINQELDTIMNNHYPFRFGLVDSNITDEEMIAQGYLMVLRKLENNGESLKRMLGYEVKADETIYISVKNGDDPKVSKFKKSDVVHKYYVQQLYTKDIYLGAEWDAASTWQQALINHTENINAALKNR